MSNTKSNRGKRIIRTYQQLAQALRLQVERYTHVDTLHMTDPQLVAAIHPMLETIEPLEYLQPAQLAETVGAPELVDIIGRLTPTWRRQLQTDMGEALQSIEAGLYDWLDARGLQRPDCDHPHCSTCAGCIEDHSETLVGSGDAAQWLCEGCVEAVAA